jgi:hypothetical protein
MAECWDFTDGMDSYFRRLEIVFSGRHPFFAIRKLFLQAEKHFRHSEIVFAGGLAFLDGGNLFLQASPSFPRPEIVLLRHPPALFSGFRLGCAPRRAQTLYSRRARTRRRRSPVLRGPGKTAPSVGKCDASILLEA